MFTVSPSLATVDLVICFCFVFCFCNILFGQEQEYIVCKSAVYKWQLYDNLGVDNMILWALWPKRIGQETDTV